MSVKTTELQSSAVEIEAVLAELGITEAYFYLVGVDRIFSLQKLGLYGIKSGAVDMPWLDIFCNREYGKLLICRYLTEKMNTYNRAMGNLDNILDYERPEQVVYYIRGQFNNWSDQSQYAMTIKDGKATITLNIPSGDDRARRFKVYNCITQMWYQDVSEESTANYSYLGDHRNIVLPQGRYKIVFDIETELITITPA